MDIRPFADLPQTPSQDWTYPLVSTGYRRGSEGDGAYLMELKDRMKAQYGEPARGGAQARVQHRNFGIAQLPKDASAAKTAQRKRHVGIGLGVLALATVIGVAVGLSVRLTRKATIDLDPQQLSGAFNRSFAGVNLSTWDIFDDSTNGGAVRCGFSQSAVKTNDDALEMFVTPKQTAEMPASCAQLVYKQPFTYGRFSARMQPAPVSGIVTAFFLYNMTSPGLNQEVDIEFTGQNTSSIHATSFRDAKVTTNIVPLGFDAANATHDYAFDWQPDSIAWSVDGIEINRQTNSLPNYAQQRLFLSTWLRISSDWGGVYDEAGPIPTGKSLVEWVAYEPFSPSAA